MKPMMDFVSVFFFVFYFLLGLIEVRISVLFLEEREFRNEFNLEVYKIR